MDVPTGKKSKQEKVQNKLAKIAARKNDFNGTEDKDINIKPEEIQVEHIEGEPEEIQRLIAMIAKSNNDSSAIEDKDTTIKPEELKVEDIESKPEETQRLMAMVVIGRWMKELDSPEYKESDFNTITAIYNSISVKEPESQYGIMDNTGLIHNSGY